MEEKKEKKKLDEEACIAHIHNNITTRTFNGPLTSYEQKEDLEALVGALGLLRNGKIVDLSAQIKTHLEDPNTCKALGDNPLFSVLYGLKWCGHVANPTSSGTSTPSASTSLPLATNAMSNPQPLVFLQMQGSVPIPYPNHLSYT
ncbi:uncharacterized protein EDB91DRAFT_1252831 [Suillus paluster]|uniref:uncharacterized protein n=1 Tax=Suillus paluster TaxID=48578 RepID=UPI001B887208|nr:uncharacterized protein EDB91DRAFT_1252831 [Suillus paluster]KAG1729954.1 hypothetical protein EDB91DRAFT_1252831 [Suillus paluster]